LAGQRGLRLPCADKDQCSNAIVIRVTYVVGRR